MPEIGSQSQPTSLQQEPIASPFHRDFWQQSPDLTQATFCYYNSRSGAYKIFPQKGKMDAAPLIIGPKPCFFGSTAANSDKNKPKRTPTKTVDVYVDGNFVRRMPLRLLVRFSKYAAEQYPRITEAKEGTTVTQTPSPTGLPVNNKKSSKDGAKPKAPVQANESSNTEREPGIRKEAESGKTASTNEGSKRAADKVKPQSLFADMERLALTHALKNDKLNANSALPQTQAIQQPRELELALDTLPQAPSVKAVNMCLGWMFMNKDNHGKERPLKPFELPSPETPLHAFVDVYAAVYCLDLRPFPHNLRNAINDRLTRKKPLASDIQYMHERIPREEVIFRRMVTSYFQHYDRREYTTLEDKAIHDYVENVDANLLNHFTEVEESRGKRKQQRHRARILQGWDELAATRPSGYKEATHETKAIGKGGATAEPKQAEKERKGHSIGINGRHVPGDDQQMRDIS